MENDTYAIIVTQLVQEVRLAGQVLAERVAEEGRTQGRLAVTAVVGEHETFGIAEENQPGYWPSQTWLKGISYPDARRIADDVNWKLGLAKEDASAIITSSIREQNIKNGVR